MRVERLVASDDFPILQQTVYDKPLVYLDSAATTQRPIQVIEKMRAYGLNEHSNTGRSSHYLAMLASERLEEARDVVRSFIGAQSTQQIIFTKSATESLNMVAVGFGMQHIEKDDEIVVLISEHHANLLPWQRLAKMKKAKLQYMYLNENLKLTQQEIEEKITNNTKLVAISHVSNVLGYMNPVEAVIRRAHEKGGIVVVDGTQSVPHFSVDVTALDADFYIFSGHKMLGPTGVGVLYGKMQYLEQMEPFLLGGSMVDDVTEESVTYTALPHRLEAGTLHVEGIIGLGEAIHYLRGIGMEKVREHDKALVAYAIDQLESLPYIQIIGREKMGKTGVIAFNVEGVHSHDVGSILDREGIAIRVGHHCAHPLMKHLEVHACCRLSFSVYNTSEDIDQLIHALKKVRKVMRLES